MLCYFVCKRVFVGSVLQFFSSQASEEQLRKQQLEVEKKEKVLGWKLMATSSKFLRRFGCWKSCNSVVLKFLNEWKASGIDTLGSKGGPLDFCRIPKHFHGMNLGVAKYSRLVLMLILNRFHMFFSFLSLMWVTKPKEERQDHLYSIFDKVSPKDLIFCIKGGLNIFGKGCKVVIWWTLLFLGPKCWTILISMEVEGGSIAKKIYLTYMYVYMYIWYIYIYIQIFVYK